MDTENPRVQTIRQSVRSSYNELSRLFEQRLSHLPEQVLHTMLIEGEWTLMESIAHVSEFMRYWGDEIVKLVAHPGQKFGRTKEDKARIRAIEEHKDDSLETAHDALTRSYTYLDEVLSALQDSDLELKGHHSKFGERTLAWFIKDFVTDHLTDHIEQLNTCLEAV